MCCCFIHLQPRQYTLKERDMVVKNTELTFRVSRLEEQNARLEKENRELVRGASAGQRVCGQLGCHGGRARTHVFNLSFLSFHISSLYVSPFSPPPGLFQSHLSNIPFITHFAHCLSNCNLYSLSQSSTLPLSNSPILPFSHSPILPFFHSPTFSLSARTCEGITGCSETSEGAAGQAGH